MAERRNESPTRLVYDWLSKSRVYVLSGSSRRDGVLSTLHEPYTNHCQVVTTVLGRGDPVTLAQSRRIASTMLVPNTPVKVLPFLKKGHHQLLASLWLCLSGVSTSHWCL